MIFKRILKDKSFLIYGLGLTGESVLKFLKKSKARDIFLWDDKKKLRNKFKVQGNENLLKKKIIQSDYIVLSPGISLLKCKHRKLLNKNKNKIITDIDLFFLTNKVFKSVVVTGTNGKSTTCSIIQKILSYSGLKTVAVGNIGKPILNYNLGKKRNVIMIVEMSSFQLEYSKHVRPNHAILINISKDHLDWHGSIKNYINAKLKIFSLQNNNDFAYLPQDKNIISFFKKNKFQSSIFPIKNHIKRFIKKNIKNSYLKSNSNIENLSFVYNLKKNFGISDRKFFLALKKFKGLPHRQEMFLRKKNIYFINDSKATSFEAAKDCLTNYKNIIWIVGGLKKQGDKFYLNHIKKNVAKAFIIGKDRIFFKKELNKKINFRETINLQRSVKYIFTEIRLMNLRNKNKDKIFVILSPASASYDQFRSFEVRGNKFKRLVKKYAKKYF
tara:strand:+ start:356 stop:1678 length:1323 start_codon:yes stop_codon:yes gene_type:complete